MRTAMIFSALLISSAIKDLALSNGYIFPESDDVVIHFLGWLTISFMAMDIVDFFRGSK